MAQLGQASKQSTWVVQAGREAKPIEIKLHVDRKILTSPEVGVEFGGQRVFPLSGYHSTGKLREDFIQQLPFRAVAKDIGQPDAVEIRPAAFRTMEGQQWFTATLMRQRPDGLFEALAWMPDAQGGFKQVAYPAIPARDIRYRSTGSPFVLPERVLRLQVPAADPLHATLTIDNNELVTHFFGRPTPNPAQDVPVVLMKVSKDHQTITSNVGHQVFSHHMSQDVRLVKQFNGRGSYSRTWVIQIGPFAEHTIDLQYHWTSKLMSLNIDGEKLVEAAAEDIDSPQDRWECKFRFVGERRIDYEVHESNKDGMVLDSKSVVSQKQKYTRECVVSVRDSDVASAELMVDATGSGNWVSFRDLMLKREVHREDELRTSAVGLYATYGVSIPHKVNEQAPCGLAGVLNGSLAGIRDIVAGTDDATSAQGGIFGGAFHCCMQSPRVVVESNHF